MNFSFFNQTWNPLHDLFKLWVGRTNKILCLLKSKKSQQYIRIASLDVVVSAHISYAHATHIIVYPALLQLYVPILPLYRLVKMKQVCRNTFSIIHKAVAAEYHSQIIRCINHSLADHTALEILKGQLYQNWRTVGKHHWCFYFRFSQSAWLSWAKNFLMI